MKDINLTLSLEEVNSVLNTLGTQPYGQVQPLIVKIQTQGSAQLQAAQNGQQQVGEESGKARSANGKVQGSKKELAKT